VSKLKVMFLDIETTAIKGHVWQMYDTNVVHMEEDWKLLSFAWKWLGGKSVSCVTMGDVDNEGRLVQKMYDVVEQADIIIAHNGDRFDIPKARAKFIEYGLGPTAPFKTIDTLKIAKRHFKFTSNKLNDLAKLLGIGTKIDTGGYSLWIDCMAGDKKALAKMGRYNKHDVVLLEKVYKKMRAWLPNHPNLSSVDKPDNGECRVCGSSDLIKRGKQRKITQVVQIYQCKGCGHYSSKKV